MDAEWAVVWYGFLGSLLAGLATAIGAMGVFLVRQFSERVEVLMLSLAAGIMLAATFFSLIQPALEISEQLFQIKTVAVAVVIGGLLLGAAVLLAVHRYVPHEHLLTGHEGPQAQRVSRIWLFVFAIALHNFPEGMAVGVGFAGGDIGNGISLATGIGIQNIPEGLAVAAALMAINYSRLLAFSVGALTGLIEPLGGLFGAAAVWLAAPMLPVTLGFAAGAMLFIISDEIIPETHRGGYANLATVALLVGFAMMMFLDALLG